jgi:hypothetical protein
MADTSWAHQLTSLDGLPLLPCGAGADRKAPIDPRSGREMSGWQHKAFTPEQIGSMNGRVACVGMRLGPDAGGLIAFDPDGASAVAAAVARGCDPAAASTWRIHRTTSTVHLKLVFRVPPERWALLRKGKGRLVTKAARPGEKGEQLEVFWTSGQVIVLGDHLSSGGRYTWRGSPQGIAAIPDAWWDLALELLSPQQPAPPPTPACLPECAADDLGRARSALEHLDPDMGHDAWVQIGMALHSADSANGLTLWNDWSAQGEKYPGFKELDRRWRSFKVGGGITIATLFCRAQNYGWINPAAGRSTAEERLEDGFREWPDGDSTSAGSLPPEPETEAPARESPLADLLALSERLAEGRRMFSFRGLLPADLADAVELLQAPLPTDVISAVLPVLSAYSGILKLGTKVTPNLGYSVPVNLFVAVVAISGIAKTSIKRALVDAPILEIRRDAARMNKREQENWQEQNRGVKPADRTPPPAPIYPVLQDYTPAALSQQLQVNEHRGLGQLIVVDELHGLLNAISQDTRNGSGTAEAQLLETFDGSGYTSIRITAGSRSYSACHVSIYGSIQPDRLRQMINGRDDTGQFARFLFCRVPTRPLNLPDEDPTPQQRDAHQAATLLLHRYAERLHRLPPRTYELSREARSAFNRWFEEHQKDALAPGTPGIISALKGKTSAHALRVAGILHILRHLDVCEDGGVDLPRISRDTMDCAMAIVDQLTAETAAFHDAPVASGGQDDEEAQDAVEASRLRLLQHIHHCSWSSKQPITRKQAKDKGSRQLRRHCTAKAFMDCVAELVAQGYGELVDSGRGVNGKPRAQAYRATKEMSLC